MAEADKLNVDSVIARLLEGQLNNHIFINCFALSEFSVVRCVLYVVFYSEMILADMR